MKNASIAIKSNFLLIKNSFRFENLILLIFSLTFYFYGEGKLTIILLFTCIFNFFIAKQIDKQTNIKKRKQYLIIGLIINIGILIYYKYTNFLIENINNIFNINKNTNPKVKPYM